MAVSGLSYLTTLQLQLAWGWPPSFAAIAMLPQVLVLLVNGRLVGPFVERVRLTHARGGAPQRWLSGCGVTAAGVVLTFVAALLVGVGILRSRSWGAERP